MKFLKWQALYEFEKPFQIFINIPAHVKDQRTTNLVYEDVQVDVNDVRTYPTSFDLNREGFTYLKHRTKLQSFTQRATIEDQYLPEIEGLIRSNVENIDRIHFFDWRLRKNAPEVEGSVIDLNDLTNWLRPAMHVHIDQSPSAVLRRIQLQLKDDAEFLLQGRIRVINVWRPLTNAVQDYPLAICDGSTVDRADLVEADHIRRQYMGSTMYLKHNQNQRFYYMSNQTKEDVLMFKNFDSDRTMPAQFAPHASFMHPDVPVDAIPRESIEVRALVFTYPVGTG